MNISAFLAVIAATFTMTAATPLIGSFEYEHSISLNGYPDQQSCEDDEGVWEEGTCLFPGFDDVTISEEQGQGLAVTVSTIGNNANECFLEGTASALDLQTLRVSASYEETRADGTHKTLTCDLTVRATDEAFSKVSVSVDTPAECQYYCGANVSLAIGEATRLEAAR